MKTDAKKHYLTKPLFILLVGVISCSVFFGLWTYSQAQEQGQEISICVRRSGVVYVVGEGFRRKGCFRNDKLLTFNIQGPQGPQGVQGEPGPQGKEGSQGHKGDKGDSGDMGPAGPQGLKGDKGDQGEIGEQGLKGDKGDSGDMGPAGPQGPQGEKGDQGEPGWDEERIAAIENDLSSADYAFCQQCDNIPWNCTRQEAAEQCESLSMHLCSLAELNHCAEIGLSSCCGSWVSDPDLTTLLRTKGTMAYFMGPSTRTGISEECGGDPGGMRIINSVDHLYKRNAHCCK